MDQKPKNRPTGRSWHFTYLRAMPAQSEPLDNNKEQNRKDNNTAQVLSSHRPGLMGNFLPFALSPSIARNYRTDLEDVKPQSAVLC